MNRPNSSRIRSTLLALLVASCASAPGREARGADTLPRFSVASVYASDCEKDSQLHWMGGLPFEHAGRLYMLTVHEATWYRSARAACIVASVELESGESERIEADVVAAEWGNGLALLALKRLPEKWRAYGLDELASKTLPSWADYRETERPRSDRHYFSLLPYVREVRMSTRMGATAGHASVSREGELRGIYSTQYLAIVPGLPTQIFTLRELYLPQASMQGALVIPAAIALPWARDAIERGARSRLRLIAQTYVSGGQFRPSAKTVRAGELEFVSRCEAPPPHWGAGTLGPVGGGNGVGVGGSNGRGGLCVIKARRAAESSAQWPFAENDASREIQARLGTAAEIEIRSIGIIDPVTELSFDRPINSMEQFFSLIARPDARLGKSGAAP